MRRKYLRKCMGLEHLVSFRTRLNDSLITRVCHYLKTYFKAQIIIQKNMTNMNLSPASLAFALSVQTRILEFYSLAPMIILVRQVVMQLMGHFELFFRFE